MIFAEMQITTDRGRQMTVKEFADLVEKMRKAQKEYFKMRTGENLLIAKNFEKQVDDALEERQKNNAEKAQPKLNF